MLINKTVLVSGAEYFNDTFAINAYMDNRVPVDRAKAIAEHNSIRAALEQAGAQVIKIGAPSGCQDGVYTANWALVRGDIAVTSNLPNKRTGEEAYAEKALRSLGKKIVKPPEGMRFSGQGDALACGNQLFMGATFRTDLAAHRFVADALGYEVVSLQTVPKRTFFGFGPAVTNAVTGWPDSFFYDLDLALAILRYPTKQDKGLIAWCPEAFTRASRARLQALDTVEKIAVSLEETKHAHACNIVSTGEAVVMGAHAPQLQQKLETLGFKVFTPEIQELSKGGGYIRCTTLSLDNS